MRKTLFSLLLVLMAVATASAQRSFRYKDLTNNNEKFNMTDKAGLIIICNSNKPLSFESNLDTKVDIFRKQTEGENTLYYLILDASGVYRNRQLSVKSAGYYTFTFQPNLRNSYTSRYEIYDPDDAVDGTRYQNHRVKAMQYLEDCSYLAAKEQFELAKQCDGISQSQINEAQQHIDECDSILKWRRLGYEEASLLHYESAMEYFSKIMSVNSQDRDANSQYAQCANAQAERASKYFEAAEKYFKDKEYEDAIFMYKKVEELRESNVATALSRRVAAERILNHRKNANAFVSLDFGLNGKNKSTIASGTSETDGEMTTVYKAPNRKMYGITLGSYRNRTGGYFSIKGNEYLVDLANGDYRIGENPELDITFGWTIPVIKKIDDIFQGLYIHFGPGFGVLDKYTGDSKKFSEYGTDITDDQITQEMVDAKLKDGSKLNKLIKHNYTLAITPEIGMAVKIWKFALRGTYTYRFAVSKKYEDCFQKKQWSIGIGICY